MLGLSMLAGYLRSVGRHRDAAEVDELNSPDAPARQEAAGDERPTAPAIENRPDMAWHGSSSDPHTPGGGVVSSSGSSGAGAEAGAGRASSGPEGASSGASAEAVGGHAGAGGAGAAEGSDAGTENAQPQPETHTTTEPSPHGHDLADDPLAGLHSDRLRENLSRDAFLHASTTAQDSAIASEADTRASRIATLPACLRDALAPFADLPDVPLPDHRPAARQARIDALAGEIPDWAKGDPENDPKLIKMLSQPAADRDANRDAKQESSLASGLVYLRDPAESPHDPAAVVASRLADRMADHAPAQPPAHAPAQPPAPAPRAPSGDREM